jgi:Ca2+-binding EF-hand superfamily protein
MPTFTEVRHVAEQLPPMLSKFPDKAHHEWTLRMWNRMDRDQSGTISRKELDCEEMRTVMRLVLVSQDDSNSNVFGGGASYARARMNHIEALGFCLRKADINNDGTLSFEEFKNFIWELRQETGRNVTNLVFALFDLDADHFISENEFREIFRFYLGRNPTFEQFTEEWNDLNRDAATRGVSRDRYTRWLETTANPMFTKNNFIAEQRKSLPTSQGDTVDSLANELATAARARIKKVSKKQMLEEAAKGGRFPKDADGWPLASRNSIHDRPKWYQKFNTEINKNSALPKGERKYFSKTQSMPQLGTFYTTHCGFERQLDKLQRPPPCKRLRVVSTDTTDDDIIDPGRHLPGGTMRDTYFGETALWEDRWQTPLRFRARFRASDRPLPPHAFFEASHQHIGPMAPRLNRLYG